MGFGKHINRCYSSATLGDRNDGNLPVDTAEERGGEVSTAPALHNGEFLQNSVAVFTRNSAGNLEDHGFQLLVFC